MFTQLFFVILVLLIAGIAPLTTAPYWDISPTTAFSLAIGVYLCLLLLIYNRAKMTEKNGQPSVYVSTNFKLILFLLFFYFIVAAHRFLIENISASTLASTVLSIVFYLVGLFTYHLGVSQRTTWQDKAGDAFRHMRIIIPFLIPFLIIVSFDEIEGYLSKTPLSRFFHEHFSSLEINVFVYAVLGLFILGVFVIFPYFTQKIWKCVPLTKEPLKTKLDALCEKAHFTHAGFKVWTVMNSSITAAILGIVPRFRYVIFTQGLLDNLSDEEVESVLAHEIGHTRHKHLLIYPFILLGGILLTSVIATVFLDSAFTYFDLQNMLKPSPLWDSLKIFLILIFYAVVLSIYFRVVFGYFSRLFERQADLTPIELGLPPESMIKALDTVGTAAGNIHKQPSWHHYSIEERITFLQEVEKNPSLIKKQESKIRYSLMGYVLLLIVMGAILLADFFPATPGFVQINQAVTTFSQRVTDLVTEKKRIEVAETLEDRYQIPGSGNDVFRALDNGLKNELGSNVPGLAEYYAAKDLDIDNQPEAAALLMIHAWEKLPTEDEYKIFFPYFTLVSYSVINKLPEDSTLKIELIEVILNKKLDLNEKE